MLRGEMFLQPAARSAEMDAAHADPSVQTAARTFLAHPRDGMLKLLAQAMQYPYDRRSFRSMILTAGLPNEAHGSAYDFLDAMAELWKSTDPGHGYCRGALLEAIALGLMQNRTVETDGVVSPVELVTEQCVGPFPAEYWKDGLSDPIDIVAPAAPEFYECKTGLNYIRSKHLEQFRLIQTIDSRSLTAFVTLAKAETLIDLMTEFHLPEFPKVYAFTLEDFLSLSERQAEQQIA